ncbi:hypothetical protein EYF80_024192 [Liparis tanakae]|uniref:Uncharacterized protein n=1 Tax=Liparis tanakae TaxID=230148 RepID=A0A4Z2HL04_9TELE|nr:hypothetical protein EYF80_024192 [Liparis tanakae]
MSLLGEIEVTSMQCSTLAGIWVNAPRFSATHLLEQQDSVPYLTKKIPDYIKTTAAGIEDITRLVRSKKPVNGAWQTGLRCGTCRFS